METKYMEKIKSELETIKRILNNKNAVIKLGMMLTIAGFIIGWVSGFIKQYSMDVGIVIMQTGTLFMYIGIIFIGYYVLRFSNTKKSDTEPAKTEDITTEIINDVESIEKVKTEKQTI